MLFAAIKGPTHERAKTAIQAVEGKVDGFELRLDLFSPFEIQNLLSLSQKPFLFTVRDTSRLEELCRLEPTFVDVPIETPHSLVSFMQKKFPRIKWIGSLHNFNETPDLKTIARPSHFHLIKIAAHARSTLDTLRMMDFVRAHQPIIGISMGHYGEISRILGPVMGNAIDYACVTAEEATAPGQLTVQEHYPSLSPKTRLFGLIGGPQVSHSLSRHTHNEILKPLGGVYVRISVAPEELSTFLQQAKRLGFEGFSVTMPLKEAVMPYLDDLDETALAIGSVNTIVRRGEQYIGTNTDGMGALDAIEQRKPVKGQKMVVIGAGGSAKAIAYEAVRRGAELLIVNRTSSKAHTLAKSLGCLGGELNDIGKFSYDILVNCTPDLHPIDFENVIPGTVVMDIITTSRETPLLIHAREKNCSVVYGFEMFMNQAARQFELWFSEFGESLFRQNMNFAFRSGDKNGTAAIAENIDSCTAHV